jgi:hypothetical protein
MAIAVVDLRSYGVQEGGRLIRRVLRGGSFNNTSTNVRAANRNNNRPDDDNNNVSFRPSSTCRRFRKSPSGRNFVVAPAASPEVCQCQVQAVPPVLGQSLD